LEEYSTVWWAWWKKDSEPDRRVELQELSELLRKNPVYIGIFDRSTERFFRALLHGCVYSPSNKIRCPVEGGTPDYVRDASVPAWFEISKLASVSRETFISEFGGVPPSDHTLFPVRHVVHEPKTHTAIRSEGSVTEGWQNLRGSVIVHLSDLHFGEDFGYSSTAGPGQRRLADVITEDLSRAKVTEGDIGLIIVSGDLTTKGVVTHFFEEVKEFLTELCDRFSVDPDRVLIVPGNHDFRLLTWNPRDYSHENAFLNFLAAFYGTRTDKLPQVYQGRLENGIPLEILLVNSVRVRHETDRNYGYVGWDRYEGLLTKSAKARDAVRIAVLHHHLFSTTQEEEPNHDWHYANVSVTLDAGRVIDGLQRHGFQLVLHGHQHVPAISRVARGRRQDDKPSQLDGLKRTIYLVGAGSAGSNTSRLSREFPYNSYNILRIEGNHIDIEARQYTTAPGSSRAWRCKVPLVR
jgi:predicted MPP superfamily phosphohydrolase